MRAFICVLPPRSGFCLCLWRARRFMLLSPRRKRATVASRMPPGPQGYPLKRAFTCSCRNRGVAVPHELILSDRDALIVVDVQNDFLPGGALPVAEGGRVHAPLNALMPMFSRRYATRDWHPRNHRGFIAHGGRWPFHCVQGTIGAELSPRLLTQYIDEVVPKGIDPDTEGYSAFDGTDLEARLREAEVKRVFVAGLATDYCVKATALEA